MILPLQVTFRNMESSDLVEGWIREEAEKLDTFYPRIMGCRVVVERPSRRHKWGSLYHVRIDVKVPSAELVVKEQPSLHSSIQSDGQKTEKHLELKAPHKDLRQAIDDAFKTAGRRLQDYARRQRGDVKRHEPLARARVSQLFSAQGYGFLETPGGREIYFHRNSVLDPSGFDELKIGSVVSFTEESGDQGPQASTVRVIRRPKRAQVETTAPV